jgi:hypothetical protein
LSQQQQQWQQQQRRKCLLLLLLLLLPSVLVGVLSDMAQRGCNSAAAAAGPALCLWLNPSGWKIWSK